MRAASFFDGRMLREGTLVSDAAGIRLLDAPAPAGTPRLDGIVTGRFTDHHVHLQLVNAAQLEASRLGRVFDLGADLDVIRTFGAPSSSPRKEEHAAGTGPAASFSSPHGVRVEFVGPFLTVPGGYPSDREWAPAGSVVEIADTADAASIVPVIAASGVSALKVTLNSTAGPVPDDDLLSALGNLAAQYGLALIAHAEGPGQAQRAARLGATALAHAPFTERLDDAEIAEQAASVAWISTLAIHDGGPRAIAIDNVRRFAAAAGDLRYGTDMGNGPTPVDLSADEIAALHEAGVTGIPLLRALAPADTGPLLILPDGDPARARRLTAEDLED
jgi:hypothetical protein